MGVFKMAKGPFRFLDDAGIAARKFLVWKSTDSNDAASGLESAFSVGSTTAASTAVTNDTAETDFDTTVSIPTEFIEAGTTFHIQAQGIATATQSTDTLTVKLYVGAVEIVTTGAVDVADNDIFVIDAWVTFRTVGSSGTLVASGGRILDAAGTAIGSFSKASTAINTTTDQTVKCSAQWSVAATANSCRLDQLVVTRA